MTDAWSRQPDPHARQQPRPTASLYLTAGQVSDVLAAPALLDGFSAETVLADKAYDSNAFRHAMDALNVNSA